MSYAETKQSEQSNHLGSASWITDGGGVAVQYIQYLLYGEPYDNQPPTGYRSVIRSPGRWVAFVGRGQSRGSSGASEGES